MFELFGEPTDASLADGVGTEKEMKKLSEKSPLVRNRNEKTQDCTGVLIPNEWIADNVHPPTVALETLCVPLQSSMPSTLEYDGEEIRDLIGDQPWNIFISESSMLGSANERLQMYVIFFYYIFAHEIRTTVQYKT